MKRLIYYLLLIGSVTGATCVALFVAGFVPEGSGMSNTGLKVIEDFVVGLVDGTHVFGYTAQHIFIYGLTLFLILNAALILTLLLIFLISGFNLRRISKFYRISIWFLVASLLFTGVYGYLIFDILDTFNFTTVFAVLPWSFYLPLGLSLIMAIVGLVFKLTSRKK